MPVIKATVEQTVGFEPTTRSELLIAPLSTHLSYVCESTDYCELAVCQRGTFDIGGLYLRTGCRNRTDFFLIFQRKSPTEGVSSTKLSLRMGAHQERLVE